LEFNVPFQHKYGYIRDESARVICRKLQILPISRIYDAPVGNFTKIRGIKELINYSPELSCLACV